MTIEQRMWTPTSGWQTIKTPEANRQNTAYQLILAFGEIGVLDDPDRFEELRRFYPDAHIISCSTAGEILGDAVYDGTISATAIAFDSTRFAVSVLDIADCTDSNDAGVRLASSIPQEGLVHVFVLSDGQQVNGSCLVRGLSEALAAPVTITGGLAGDDTRFERTLVGMDAPPSEGKIVAIGFYGDALRVGFGSIGGWDSFGPDRVITRSSGNVLYELDGQSALDLYKRYLGDLANELPGSAILFPLSIRTPEQDTPVVRTILSIDEEAESMTFAGDMPQGAYARLMKANFDRLIDGASLAASHSHERIGESEPDLAILISCVGRKVVLGQRTEEEVEAVRDVLGNNTAMAGFYSYGEISPFVESPRCELHNQTMTITTFSERVNV